MNTQDQIKTFGDVRPEVDKVELNSLLGNFEVKEHKNPLVIYHGNCADGFSAAWCFHNARDYMEVNFDFHPGIYGEDPPDVDDRIVYIVDFSYKRNVMEDMLNRASHIYFIDHHKSALEDLACFYDRQHHAWEDRFGPKFTAYVDLNRSGAMLAWDYIHNTRWSHGSDGSTMLIADYRPGDLNYISAPILLEHVQDRDLWKFRLEGTKEISAAIFSREYTFDNWDDMMLGQTIGSMTNAITRKLELHAEGRAILRKHFKDINEIIALGVRWTHSIGGIYMPVINVPYMMGSDACDIMCSMSGGVGVAAYYHDTADHRVFGLRSSKGSAIDVSRVAENYGGGGHKHAAGFKVKRSHWLAGDF